MHVLVRLCACVCVAAACAKVGKHTRGGTRTRNLLLRREAPYPLGHTSTCIPKSAHAVTIATSRCSAKLFLTRGHSAPIGTQARAHPHHAHSSLVPMNFQVVPLAPAIALAAGSQPSITQCVHTSTCRGTLLPMPWKSQTKPVSARVCMRACLRTSYLYRPPGPERLEMRKHTHGIGCLV